MKYVFIINPVSGLRVADQIILNIKKVMQNKKYEIYETKGPKDATKIASRFKDEKNTIVYAVGGDGTLNEVVNGIAEGSCMLGVIPTGSGNDFYKSLEKYSKNFAGIDLGKANNTYFINVASAGLDAEIAYLANELKSKGKNPKTAYVKALIKKFFNFDYKDLEIAIGGKVLKQEFTLIAVCNGRYYGGGFKIAPLASFDDDKFDIYYADKVGRFKLLRLVLKLLRGKHEKSKAVHKVKATSITIKSKKDIVINVDGEMSVGKKVNIQMIPNALTIYHDKKLVGQILEDI